MVVVRVVTCVCSRGPIKGHKSKTMTGTKTRVKRRRRNFLVLAETKLKNCAAGPVVDRGWRG